MRIDTILAQAGSRWDERTGAVTMPIYQTATFRHPALGESTGYDYSRSGNPTRQVLEDLMAVLDGGSRAFAFSSGMAAVDCLFRLFQPGDRVIVTEDLYGGTYRLLEKVYRPLGVEVVYADTSRTEEVAALLDERVKALFVETPTNPLLKVADLSALAELTRERGILLVVDNTFLSPWLQRPLTMGADVVVYSATKYLAGHNDVVGGIIVVKDEALAEKIYFHQNAAGAVLGPMDCWLTLRGLKTLALRLKRQQENAARIAAWLQEHPRVCKVYYPGLPEHPGHEVMKKQAYGFGGMISFEVDDPGRIPAILAGVKVFLFAESLGGVESLITYPVRQTHADMEPEVLNRLGINERLLRLSVGVEDSEDLIADLARVL